MCRKGNSIKRFQDFYLKSGLDCLRCAILARHRLEAGDEAGARTQFPAPSANILEPAALKFQRSVLKIQIPDTEILTPQIFSSFFFSSFTKKIQKMIESKRHV